MTPDGSATTDPEADATSAPDAEAHAPADVEVEGEPHPPQQAEANGQPISPGQGSTPVPGQRRQPPGYNADRHVPQGKQGWFGRLLEKLDAKFSRLSTRNNFWHRCFSWIFLPLAYRSGVKIKHVTSGTFSVVLPFRRFNKNWYSAMAGAALLGNTEVAGGMFVFNKCGGDFTVVCKNMNYRFLRPCYGPAIYNIEPREDVDALVTAGDEFNITLDISIVQAVHKKDKKERRVGRAEITFHATPKTQARARMQRRIERLREGANEVG